MASIGIGRLAHALTMPVINFCRSNASRRLSCLMTINPVCAMRS